MLIARQRHLGLAVCGPDPGATNLDATATERDLAVIVAKAHSGPVAVPLSLRTNDLVDPLLRHLAQHTNPDSDAEREQAFLRCPDRLAERSLHALRQHDFIVGRLCDRYGLLRDGSSLDLCGITATAPNQSGRGGRTAVTSDFYTRRDNLTEKGRLL